MGVNAAWHYIGASCGTGPILIAVNANCHPGDLSIGLSLHTLVVATYEIDYRCPCAQRRCNVIASMLCYTPVRLHVKLLLGLLRCVFPYMRATAE